jgi:DNA repair protein RecO (recombination protein O)
MVNTIHPELTAGHPSSLTMGIEKIQAVVMRSFPLGETSRIVHLLSAERGRVHVVAKGVRGPRGRFGAALEPFTRIGAMIYYRSERDLQFLSQADIVARRDVLGSSLARFAYANAVIELLDQALAGEEPGPALFDLVDSSLEALERVPETELRSAFLSYAFRLMGLLGYRPELEHCVHCGREPGEGVAFAAAQGGVVCRNCAGAETLRLPAEALSGLRKLFAGGALVELSRAAGEDLARGLDAFLRAHLPRYRGLRSLKMAQEVSVVG